MQEKGSGFENQMLKYHFLRLRLMRMRIERTMLIDLYHSYCRITFDVLLDFHFDHSSGFPSLRIYLSPFTKDIREGEQLNESID